MASDLNTTAENLQWSVSAYMIAIGIAMVPGSRLGDLIGRKQVLLIGLTIFGLASLWVGLSPTANSVITARIVQGLGAGLYFPVAFSLVSNATTDAERPKMLGMLSGVAGIGTAAGPIMGGLFVSTIGWRWVFLVNVPVAAIGVIWGYFQLKESKDPELAGKTIRNMDWLGILFLTLLVCGLSGLTAGLMFIPAAVGLSLGGPVSGRLATKFPGQRVMTVAMVAGALTLIGLALSANLGVYLSVMGFAAFFLGLGFQFGNIAIQGVVKLSQAGAAAGVLLTLMVTSGGIAVVMANASLETIAPGGLPDQKSVSVTLLIWAAIVGVLGIGFGLWQWKSATPPDSPNEPDTSGAAIDRELENKFRPA